MNGVTVIFQNSQPGFRHLLAIEIIEMSDPISAIATDAHPNP